MSRDVRGKRAGRAVLAALIAAARTHGFSRAACSNSFSGALLLSAIFGPATVAVEQNGLFSHNTC
jgi:hypothetical protein